MDQSSATALREHLVANLFDGDDAGLLTAPIAGHVDDIVEVVGDWLDRKVELWALYGFPGVPR